MLVNVNYNYNSEIRQNKIYGKPCMYTHRFERFNLYTGPKTPPYYFLSNSVNMVAFKKKYFYFLDFLSDGIPSGMMLCALHAGLFLDCSFSVFVLCRQLFLERIGL